MQISFGAFIHKAPSLELTFLPKKLSEAWSELRALISLPDLSLSGLSTFTKSPGPALPWLTVTG